MALSPTGTVLLWNKAAERLFGSAAEELLGRSYRMLPADPAAVEEQRQLFARMLEGETFRDTRLRCRTKDARSRRAPTGTRFFAALSISIAKTPCAPASLLSLPAHWAMRKPM